MSILQQPGPVVRAIDKLQAILHEKLWLMIMSIDGTTFYGDESGTHDRRGRLPGSDVVAVAGYLGKDEQWKRFTMRWRNCLKKYHVKEFHMARFLRKQEWPYRLWSDSRRQAFLEELIGIARRHTILGIGGLVPLADYNKVIPESMKREHKHPYFLSFQMTIDLLLPEVRNRFPAGEKVALIFDQNQQFANDAVESFKIIKGYRDSTDQLGSLAFGSRTDHLPLQAADLIVYMVRDHLSRTDRGQVPRDWIPSLWQKKNLKIGYCSQENLEQYVCDINEARRHQGFTPFT